MEIIILLQEMGQSKSHTLAHSQQLHKGMPQFPRRGIMSRRDLGLYRDFELNRHFLRQSIDVPTSLSDVKKSTRRRLKTGSEALPLREPEERRLDDLVPVSFLQQPFASDYLLDLSIRRSWNAERCALSRVFPGGDGAKGYKFSEEQFSTT